MNKKDIKELEELVADVKKEGLQELKSELKLVTSEMNGYKSEVDRLSTYLALLSKAILELKK